MRTEQPKEPELRPYREPPRPYPLRLERVSRVLVTQEEQVPPRVLPEQVLPEQVLPERPQDRSAVQPAQREPGAGPRLGPPATRRQRTPPIQTSAGLASFAGEAFRPAHNA